MIKYLVCSDIHGSFFAAEKILCFYKNFSCNKLILLGDTLYHGPRNDLPENYNPKFVAEALNKMNDEIIACRGNCDAEVDQKVLKFPTMSDYVQIIENDFTIFCSHGHVYAPINPNGKMPENCEDAKMPNLPENSVFFYGHTHISVLEKRTRNFIVCNPGSTSIPKGETEAGFAIYENDSGKRKISLLNMNGTILKEISF